MSEELKQIDLSLLLIDDDQALQSSLPKALNVAGFTVRSVPNPSEGLKAVGNGAFDIILCDLKMPDMDGLGFIERCRKLDPEAVIVMISANGNKELALQALRLGAYDYIEKPFAAHDLIFAINKIAERLQLRKESSISPAKVKRRYSFSNIVAKSKQMLDIFETIKRLANFKTTVLITGESGCGKELLARAIHYNSERRSAPFIAINCGAIPENLIESELFGHKKGAFTDASRDKPGLFEEADGGTILLDEIGELPLHLQVKLLRVLQEQHIRAVGSEELKPIDVRVIAATHRDLEDEVMTGRFREDLFYRLNVITIRVPALRERIEDLPPIIEVLIEKHNKRLGLSIRGLTPEALKTLMDYTWPGNVRELENCIERAMVLSDTEEITKDSLTDHIRGATQPLKLNEEELVLEDDDNLSIKDKVKNLEISLIRKALAKTKGNRTHAAKVLEISHRTLLYKLKEYGLSDAEKG